MLIFFAITANGQLVWEFGDYGSFHYQLPIKVYARTKLSKLE